MVKLTEAREQHRFWNMWTNDGMILVWEEGIPQVKSSVISCGIAFLTLFDHN